MTAKFHHPTLTADGQERASVAPAHLATLWINTGTICNLSCRNCYIESTPTNDRLAYITLAEFITYLDEIENHQLGTQEIGFTGGEPFINKDCMAMIEEALIRGFRVLVLTNGMKPMMKCRDTLLRLHHTHRDALTIRVSVDHYTQPLHEEERGLRSWQPMKEGLTWLSIHGFHLHVAGRTCWGEEESTAREGYHSFFKRHSLNVEELILFPEMDNQADVPEITTQCWDILGKSPHDVMCSTSRMVVKHKGQDHPTVISCTLLPYEEGFQMGRTLRESLRPVWLNHPHCAKFCVLGGASCST